MKYVFCKLVNLVQIIWPYLSWKQCPCTTTYPTRCRNGRNAWSCSITTNDWQPPSLAEAIREDMRKERRRSSIFADTHRRPHQKTLIPWMWIDWQLRYNTPVSKNRRSLWKKDFALVARNQGTSSTTVQIERRRILPSSVWKSSHRTGKRPGLDQTRTTQDWKSQDRAGLQLQSSPQSFTISKIPGPHKDRSGPVRTSLHGRYILLISANNILFTGTVRDKTVPMFFDLVKIL